MRHRDRNFCDALVRAITLGGGQPTEEAEAAAYAACFEITALKEDKKYQIALRGAKRKLARIDIREALQGLYEVAGFDVMEAAALHVEHIRGLSHQVLTKAGEVVTIREKPDYKALSDYLKMTLPQQAKKIDGRLAVMHGNLGQREVPPKISARVISDDDVTLAITEDDHEQD